MKKLLLSLLIPALAPLHSSAQWTTVCGTGDEMVVNLTTYHDSIYATGFFTNICGVTNSKYIAKWDGTTWYPVDTGLSDAGHRLQVIDDNLYLAQYRQSVDSNWVQKWDGSHFQKIGEGVYLTTAVVGGSRVPNLYDVVKYRGNIVASGEFDIVGDRHISGIMQWNGTQWDSLGSGLSGSMGSLGVMYPHQMLVVDTSLYVVGNFTTAGGVTVNGIARWDGTQWHAVGTGFNSEVYGIGIINSEIWVGGEFTMAGAEALKRIARWDGSEWVNPGFGIYYTNTTLHPYIHTIQQIGTRGIFEGGFDKVVVGSDTMVANNIIAYDGTYLSTMSGGIVNANFEGLVAYDTTVLVGGAIFAGGPSGITTNVSEYHFLPLGVKTVTTSGISVYPDPFTNALTIDHIQQGSELRLFNIVGQQVLHMALTDTKQVINTAALAPGTYVLQVSNAGAVEYRKIFRQ